MSIIYHNRHPLPSSLASNATYVSFDDLLSQSDVISLNLSLTPATKHMISTKEFEKMKKGVVIVNTARGALIDETAVVKGLEEGKVWSVGLDVFKTEPEANPKLVGSDKVVLSPHIAAATAETMVSFDSLKEGEEI
jgi:glyoxylate reductase